MNNQLHHFNWFIINNYFNRDSNSIHCFSNYTRGEYIHTSSKNYKYMAWNHQTILPLFRANPDLKFILFIESTRPGKMPLYLEYSGSTNSLPYQTKCKVQGLRELPYHVLPIMRYPISVLTHSVFQYFDIGFCVISISQISQVATHGSNFHCHQFHRPPDM